MIEKFLTRLEAKYGRHRGIPNLMTLIVAGMAAVYITDLVFGALRGFYVSDYLGFDKAAILRGEVWRVFSFIFLPPNSSMFFIIFSLMFYLMLGRTLQYEWGTLRFTLYYMCGMLCTVIAGTITGSTTNYYLNMSLFLAVAILYPNGTLNLFGMLPIKMKWMALLDILLLIPSFLRSDLSGRIALCVSLLNVALFFVDKLIAGVKDTYRRYQWRKNWRSGNWR